MKLKRAVNDSAAVVRGISCFICHCDPLADRINADLQEKM
jgi:hypothetical protein